MEKEKETTKQHKPSQYPALLHPPQAEG
ncbi:uncharacterized protein G2W53_021540 [Senna tora]|uniref:Uncharacterized protein n=1 Tax=Senna tora TaxID=362788 RepID=A0A834TLZ9_9FABA|nr:uncharacterized protein G2W53_021540 [Senna tora]